MMHRPTRLAHGGAGVGGTSSLKITKILRLVKLAKNIARLGRLKKISELKKKYEDYLEPILTVGGRRHGSADTPVTACGCRFVVRVL